jgi:hypothetical protein
MLAVETTTSVVAFDTDIRSTSRLHDSCEGSWRL